eukprot:Lankesteria_metandrocarpae@DN3693_c0_g1_i1.p1
MTRVLRRTGTTVNKTAGGGIWEQILEETARAADFQSANILLLGGRDVGKSSIIRCLQEVGFGQQKVTNFDYHQDNDSVSALDYAYINVRHLDDPDTTESLSRVNVWILQYTKHRNLLKQKLTAETLKTCAVLICLDLSKPWSIIDELKEWLDFLSEFVVSAFSSLSVEEQEGLRDTLAQYVSNYRSEVQPEKAQDFAKRHVADDTSGTAEHRRLNVNLGIPIVVCVCKADHAAELDTRITRGQIDVVEAFLRHLCYNYGAALIFTSAQDPANAKNTTLLYRYLMHRCYGFDFAESASNEVKESLFFPAGWDTLESLNEFVANSIAGSFDRPYGALVPRVVPSSKTGARMEDSGNHKREDMNTFLSRAMTNIPSLASNRGQLPANKTATPSATGQDTIRDHHPPTSPVRERRSARSASTSEGVSDRGSLVPRTSDAGSARGDPTSLRSFFHTLLKKPNEGGGDDSRATRSPKQYSANDNRGSVTSQDSGLDSARQKRPSLRKPPTGTPP